MVVVIVGVVVLLATEAAIGSHREREGGKERKRDREREGKGSSPPLLRLQAAELGPHV